MTQLRSVYVHQYFIRKNSISSRQFLNIEKGIGKRGVALALVKIFRQDLGIMALMSFIESLASFMSPLALNRLLQ